MWPELCELGGLVVRKGDWRAEEHRARLLVALAAGGGEAGKQWRKRGSHLVRGRGG